MSARRLIVCAAGIALATACGKAPTSPSSEPSAGTAAAAAVSSVVTQGLSQTAILGISEPNGAGTSHACPNGGSMTFTFESPVPPADRTTPSTFRTTSRMEPRDCRYGTTTVNGDPYMQMSSEHATTGSLVAGTISGSTSTMRTTGGLRFETNGVQGRAKYDCTDVLTITYPSTPGGSLQISRQSSGTVTWEQPLGSPVVRPCGPA